VICYNKQNEGKPEKGTNKNSFSFFIAYIAFCPIAYRLNATVSSISARE